MRKRDKTVTPPGNVEHRVRLVSSSLQRLRTFLGIDRAIFYTVLSRGWTAIAGPVSLLFVARFMSPEEQGFYYTFASVLGLQVFFDLGLSYVIMQSVSHEKARLEWADGDTRLRGDARTEGRLASYFRLSLKWYAAIALFAALLLAFAGLWFFGRYQPAGMAITWELPWLLLVGATALNLFITPFLGVLEGCGKVAEVAALRAWQGVAGSLLFWVAMALNLRLFAAPLLSFVSVAIGAGWIIAGRRAFFMNLLRTPVPAASAVHWRSEVFPFQWRISLSWLSGYFIFQLANPVLFRYHGAIEAGRMGMTMRIVDSITALAFAWVSTKSAPFGTLIAKKDYCALDASFRGAALQSVAVAAAGSIAFAALYGLMRGADISLAERLVEPLAMYCLLANGIINCVIFALAVYLRAHKQEPFLLNSLVGAIMVPCILYFLGRPYGSVGVAVGLLLGGLFVGLPFAAWVFAAKRRAWHSSSDA